MKRGKRHRRNLPWESWLDMAKNYYAEYGNLLVHRGYRVNGYQLGRWIERQRAMYNGKLKYNSLTSDRIIALEAAGMVWKLENRFQWDDWLQCAAAYKNEHGDLLIPKNYSVGDYMLGAWLSEQRKKYKAGTLEKERIDQLDRLGMDWHVGPERRSYDEWLQLAERYAKEQGHLYVPKDYITSEGKKLGQWIATQRDAYAGHRKTGMTEQQRAFLTDLGMVWDISDDRYHHWFEMFGYVAAYYVQHKKLPKRPYIKASNGQSMGNWISMQRSRLSGADGGHLDDKQKAALKSIGIYAWGDETVLKDRWNSVYDSVAAYYREHGKLPKASGLKSENGYQMGYWVAKQKRRLAEPNCGGLDEQQQMALAEIGVEK